MILADIGSSLKCYQGVNKEEKECENALAKSCRKKTGTASTGEKILIYSCGTEIQEVRMKLDFCNSRSLSNTIKAAIAD